MTFTITLLLTLRTILGTGCSVEDAKYPEAEAFYIALAKVPSFFTAQPCGSASPLHVDVFAARSGPKKIAEIRWVTSGQPNARDCLPVVFESKAGRSSLLARVLIAGLRRLTLRRSQECHLANRCQPRRDRSGF